MDASRLNRLSTFALISLSATAALLVVGATTLVILSGEPPGPPHDEGTAAHVFQLLIVALTGTSLLFLMTADWRRPRVVLVPLAAAAVLLAIAFGVLYYFEKVLGY